MTIVTSLFEFSNTAYILVNRGYAEDIGFAFSELTGYTKADILGLNISDIIKLLRLNIMIQDIDKNKTVDNLYMFTKSFEAVEVTLSARKLKDLNQSLYVLTEKPDSRIGNRFLFVDQLYHDNIIGVAIHSRVNTIKN